jgi:MYXO-CTERM domain-containing protein
MKNKTYKLTTVASLAALAGASQANAVIISNTNGFTVGNNNTNTVDWDIDGAGGPELSVIPYYSDSSYNAVDLVGFNNAFGIVGALVSTSTGEPLTPAMSNLGYSAQVTSGLAFQTGNFFSLVDDGAIGLPIGFTAGESGFIGFTFNPSGTVLYGWAEVILTEGGTAGNVEVVQWAYEDSGASITTPVPEPASTALGLGALALGAAGLRRTRARKVAA